MEDKYIVIKKSDTIEHLTEEERSALNRIIKRINNSRMRHGQKVNRYIAVNLDEPFARNILTILDNHGHDVL